MLSTIRLSITERQHLTTGALLVPQFWQKLCINLAIDVHHNSNYYRHVTESVQSLHKFSPGNETIQIKPPYPTAVVPPQGRPSAVVLPPHGKEGQPRQKFHSSLRFSSVQLQKEPICESGEQCPYFLHSAGPGRFGAKHQTIDTSGGLVHHDSCCAQPDR